MICITYKNQDLALNFNTDFEATSRLEKVFSNTKVIKCNIKTALLKKRISSQLTFIFCIHSGLDNAQSHTVGFYQKYCHFCQTFREKIDELFLRFFSLEKCSQARYARTILKVAIFLVKSDSV